MFLRYHIVFLFSLVNALQYQNISIVECLSKLNVPQDIPGTANFSQGVIPYNLRLPFTPVALAIPSTVAQVQAAVFCAANSNVTISPRSGGHSFASHSIGGEDGHLVIDMKLFNSVAVDNKTFVATIGPGARLGNVALALFNQSERAISHGVCPGVGIGGHALHGGYGLSSHTYGLTLDFIVSAEVVLADSTIVTASSTSHPDLFWALRGAGFSYGIVTSFQFRTIPAPPSNFFFYVFFEWTPAQAVAGLLALQAFANSTAMPPELNMRVITVVYGPVLLWQLQGAYHGAEDDAEAVLQPLLEVLGTEQVVLQVNATLGWIDSLYYENNNDLIPLIATGETLETPLDYNVHSTFFSKSLMAKYVNPAAMQAFVSYVFNMGLNNTRNWYVIINLDGGPTSAVSAVPLDATSFAHRETLLSFEFVDRVAVNGTYPSYGFAFLNNMVATITKTMSNETFGSYYNYADPTLTAPEAHKGYWLGHYGRLVEIKRKYDPWRRFENPQAVLSR